MQEEEMIRNVSELEKDKCTGCQLCRNLCPVKAITMQEDDEGFLYPVVARSCINCGLCAAKCPQISQMRNVEDGNMAFAVICKDGIRDKCSSGGVFKALADNVLAKGGVVCGAAFDDSFLHLNHVVVRKASDLGAVLTSKYVQSDIKNVYGEIKTELKNGKQVLFAGCPCQVDALKTYLAGIDSGRLLTVDLLCHGVPSPLAYRTFIQETNYENKKIVNVNFRAKDKGWGSLIRIDYHDKTIAYSTPDGPFMRVFYAGMDLRPSCYTCPYSSQKRIGDITLGDYWGVKKEWNDGKGTSIVFAHTLKGAAAIDEIQVDSILFKAVPYDDAVETCKKTNG